MKTTTTGLAIFMTCLLAIEMTDAMPAAGDNVGIGFVLGNPSGLSAKIPAGDVNALHFILAYDQGRGWNNRGWGNPECGNDNNCGRLYVGGDYVWYNYRAITVPNGRLPFYYGPGVWTSVADEVGMGIRFALGIEYQFATAPFDLFLEIAPGVRVVPDTRGYLSSGLGARFFF